MTAPLYLRQLKLGTMDNFVYLMGQQGAPEVTVVDPAWDVEAIEKAAAEDGKRIVSAFVTHSHNDHINGLAELLRRHDVPVHAQKSEIEFSPELRRLGADALKPLAPGEQFDIGPLWARAVHTPGHTPGSQSLWASDALASGDTVFVGACGRCDLKGGDPEEMYGTLIGVLGKLPGETRLLPGHDYGEVPISSLERERKRNPYFGFPDVASFVAYRMRSRR